ncbi:MAG: tRNA pseudouridine(55) synthase TruB [Caldilineales bacterium]|nr:tRNA pseudouridine(55) synthase TruB [Caldilineales bacterium]MDW8319370.1 tRNA pseudouridine(55) synthase TruB [Anaerolineae bacterium]
MTGAAEAMGLLNIDKPKDWTSHDVVARVRRLTGVRQVGHTGTLDPMATGVMVVCLGAATRLAEYVTGLPKVYWAEITLGVATDTYDATGRPTFEAPVPPLSADELAAALQPFTGRILQRPPIYSALKQEGEALHKRARRGEAVEVQPRPVTVYEFAPLEFDGRVLTARIACSAGTYVRSLAHDLGQALGCGGHLSALRRLAVGDFGAEEAITLEQLAAAAAAGRWTSLVLPADRAVAHLPAVTLAPDQARRLLFGQPVPAAPASAADQARAYDRQGRLLAVVRLDPTKGVWRPVKVLVQPDPHHADLPRAS